MPLLLAMFHRQIQGDHHLLELAQRRFSEARLGAEFYPSSLQELQESLEFRPLTEPRYTIHLPREFKLLDSRDSEAIVSYASRSRKDAYGLIVHDQHEMVTRRYDYLRAVETLNERLLRIDSSPYLFIEYAVGVNIEDFISFFEAMRDCERISACIDISHIGIRKVQQVYAQLHPSENVCDLHPSHSELRAKIEDVINASKSALPTVISVIRRIGQLEKPVHFHLHDSHPLSTLSPYGVCDHLSFYQKIYIPFQYSGQNIIPLLFGPVGLVQLIRTALDILPGEMLSFTLEVHPQDDRLELGTYADLFGNWKDLGNAEQMNAWIENLLFNLRLLREACTQGVYSQ